ncbi:hypothetical protein PG996_011287 [Apiospora saccharicola]|uniref:GPI-anchored cell surface glycoprotein n=1 Tax=Apiospora saccharicola TaxID=335842 RepID=A0ABR1UGX3_9PEZI
MSLGGLDSAAIKEAHEAANAEPGGWFLLKYASRDEVELHSRGTTGVVEMRKAIAQYEEESPFISQRAVQDSCKNLYPPHAAVTATQRKHTCGFEGDHQTNHAWFFTTLARATVHFNAICDNFQPYNATFELTNAKDLKDTKLAAACSLHTATGSISSSTSSLRRRRLMEITEEEEEEERERKRQSVVHDEEENQDGSEATPHSPPLSSPEPPVVLDRQQITDPQHPDFASIPDPATFSGAAEPASPSKSEFDSEPPRRQSSQLTRPELYNYSSYSYGKPKVKLAPRPSMDANLRPHTSGNYRPIAALPAGFKLSRSSKKNKVEEEEGMEQKEPDNPTTHATSTATPDQHHNPDAANTTTSLLPQRPATSSGASLKGSSFSFADRNKMTPEKARLMKAMKLREKKKKLSMQPTEIVPEPEPPKEESTVSGVQQAQHHTEEEIVHDKEDVEQAIAETELPALTMHTEANTEDTSTDSHPPSPTVGSSEVAVSTKASSLSESTDETVQYPAKDTGLDVDDGPPSPQKEEDNVDDGPLSSENEETAASYEEHNMENEPSAAEPLTSAAVPSNNETTGSTVVQHDDAADGQLAVAEVVDEPLAAESPKIRGDYLPFENATAAVSPNKATAPTDKSQIEVQIPQSHSRVVDPHNQDEPSPKSPYGVPLSRFSSNEPKSPATPTLKSRFSTQDLRKASFAEAIPVVAEVIPSPPSDAPSVKVQQPVEESNDVVAKEVSPELPSKVKRKPAAIDPARAELSRGTELSDPLLDDALLDELQAATLQHAQPMTVAKSPITPVFPSTSPRKSQVPALPRAVSNPVRNSLLVPGNNRFGSLRSTSMSTNGLSRQASNASMQSNKPAPTVGSSISQRIKALEQLRNAGGGASTEPVAPARNRPTTPSSSFFTVRKSASIREPSVSPSTTADPAGSVDARDARSVKSRDGSPDQSRVTKRDRSASVQSRLSVFEPPNPTSAVSYAPRGRPEAVQVTARIVRDGGSPFPKRPSSRDELQAYNACNLKQSPITVEHQKAEPGQEPTASDALLADAPTITEQPKETNAERRGSKQESDNGTESKRRSSLNMVKDFIKDRRTSVSSRSGSVDNLAAPSPAASSRSPTRPASAHHSSSGSLARRLSISSRRSMNSERDATPVLSPSSITEESEEKGEKQSTASRLMRRLSNSLAGSRKAQSPPASHPPVSVTKSVNPESLVSSYMGDVNVQFPDNLLWKRRSMCLDSAGYLVLSALQGHAPTAKDRVIGTKRYHMTDFRLPYIPDADIQELPNSVCLDFKLGSGLQIACEDRASQMSILHALEDVHNRYTSS